MNLVLATFDGQSMRFGSNMLTVPASVLARRSGLRAYVGREIVLGVRPEDLEDASLARSDGGSLHVQIDIHEDMGADVFVHFRVDAEPVETTDVLEAMEEQDVPGAVRERMRGGVPFIARLARDTQIREGGRLELTVDTKRLHFFDPATGAAI